MNNQILETEVQAFLRAHLKEDVHRIAMAKSPFSEVSAQELAGQLAALGKAEKKLPSWFKTENIYYPTLLSIEQCSSETTAAHKATLIKGNHVLDLTGGFGVDSFYFAKNAAKVTHCELLPELSAIAAHNAQMLGSLNIRFLNTDGIIHLQTTKDQYSTIYIDPARRGKSGKVFMLKDCSPNVVENLDLLLNKAARVIIKTSPLLDITAGIKELRNVTEVQIISTKNECKELLFILDAEGSGSAAKITSVTINEKIKSVTFQNTMNQEQNLNGLPEFAQGRLLKYLYEPDVALLKSGAFNEIAHKFDLVKLDAHTQLFTSDVFNTDFPGRVFLIEETYSKNDLRRQKYLQGNVIVRNYPGKPEELIKSLKIKTAKDEFLIFTRLNKSGYVIIKTKILQHY